PRIFVASSDRDDAIARELVGTLRANGFESWWFGERIGPGMDWQREADEALDRAQSVLMLVTRSSLQSRTFNGLLQRAVAGEKWILPIRMEPIESRDMPRELAERQWVDLSPTLAAEQRNAELSTLLQALEPISSRDIPEKPSKRPRVQPNAPAPKQQAARAAQTSIWIVGETSQEPRQLANISRDFEELVFRARESHAAFGSSSDGFDLDFKALLVALFNGNYTWSEWAQRQAERTNFRFNEVPDRYGASLSPHRLQDPHSEQRGTREYPLRVTRSGDGALRLAESMALECHSKLDVLHVTGVVVFQAADNGLERFGLNEVEWARALVAEAESKGLPEARPWAVLRDALEPQQAQTAKAAVASDWDSLDTAVKDLLRWSEAFRVEQAAEKINLRHFYASLLRLTTDAGLELLPVFFGKSDLAPTEQLRAELFERLGVELPAIAAPLLDYPPLDGEAQQALENASLLQAGPSKDTWELALFCALFYPKDPGGPGLIDATLRSIRIDPDAVLAAFAGFQKDLPNQPSAGLRATLERRRQRSVWDRSGFDSDRVSGPIPQDQDRLDVGRPALRFAKLLSSKETKPPLALGLFGNWGSGKTFFMGLMRKQIEVLTASKDEDYVRRVVQIEFNAWHYHDTTLWACLAMRIFEGLAQALNPPGESDIEAVRRELHQKLRSSQQRRAQAETIRQEALANRSRAQRRLDRKEEFRARRVKESAVLRLQAAWRYWSSSNAGRKELAVADKEVRGLKQKFGLNFALDSFDSAVRLRSELLKLKAQAFGLSTAIHHRFRGLGPTALTVGCLVLLGAAWPIIQGLAEPLSKALVTIANNVGLRPLGNSIEWLAGRLQNLTAELSAAVMQIGTVVSGVVVWCSRRVEQVSSALDEVAKVEAGLALAEKSAPMDPQEAALRKKIQALDQAIQRSTEEVGESERLIAEATAEIERIDRGGLVYDFLQDRKTSTQYTAQLGLVSTIRSDFERLGELLRDFESHGKDPIERIVLYVDDLDRCHPDKVVEVLQAVHLLLAFDLFNVVVGVDARWLERSLHRQFVSKLGGGRRGNVNGFSPHDYLEKIFQIPYVLAPLDSDNFGTLVDSIVTTRSDVAAELKAKLAAEEKARVEAAELAKAEAARVAAAEAAASGTTVASTAEATRTPASEDATAAKKDTKPAAASGDPKQSNVAAPPPP
ncbi:MAG: P-loop NTPase fold protein, partial [Planctomycetota bacterium]